jgi:rfaE bifunctional protein kinase chain/domain
VKAIVIGDIFLDEYVFGDCERISPEAPVPILRVDHDKTKRVLGGAANTAANFTSLGGKVVLFGRIGDDFAGSEVVDLCVNAGVTVCQTYEGFTTKKTRFVGQRQQLLRIDEEDDYPDLDRTLILNQIRACMDLGCDVVIVSDYAKGFLSEGLVAGIIRSCAMREVPLIVDTKPENILWYHGADYITPNLKEAQGMCVPHLSLIHI